LAYGGVSCFGAAIFMALSGKSAFTFCCWGCKHAAATAVLLLLMLLLLPLPRCCRVLSRAGRRPVNSQPAADSRPSTAASLLSLKQQQQQQSSAAAGSPSRPGTTSSSRLAPGAAGTAAAAAVPGEAGGVSSIGTAFNRTLLLELVQQDDVSRHLAGTACL